MNGTTMRERLHRGDGVYGTHICSMLNPKAMAMVAEVELDFAFFCSEHMPIDRTEISQFCHFFAARGISPLVRVTTCVPIEIAAVLDGGAQGILVPYVETVEEVKAAVGAVKYRPIKGELLSACLEGRQELPAATRAFLGRFNAEHYLIIGIESVPAIGRLEALITTEGVDAVFLGPHDISTSMGMPEQYDDPAFVATIEDVIRRCRANGVGVGVHYPLFQLPESTLRRWLDAGMNLIINGADVVIMRNAMNEQLGRLRERRGERYRPPAPADDASPAEGCAG